MQGNRETEGEREELVNREVVGERANVTPTGCELEIRH